MSQIMHAPNGMTPSAQKEYFKVLTRFQNLKKGTAEGGIRAARMAVSASTGAAIGFIEGYYELTEISEIPLAAAIAVTANLGAFFFLTGEAAEMAHNVGNAASAVAGRDWFADLGKTAREKAKHKSSSSSSSSSTTPAGYQPYNSARA